MTNVKTPLFKPGTRNDNVSFLSSWKRLSQEDPELYRQIEQKEGYECEIAGYSYHVGQNKYGLYLMRKSLNGLENIPNIERPPQRPSMDLTPPLAPTGPQSAPIADQTLIMALCQIADSLKLLALSNVARTEEQLSEVRHKCLAQ